VRHLRRLALLATLGFGSSAIAAAQAVPDLRFENPDGSATGLPILVNRDHLQRIVKLTGLTDPGGSIRVVIVPERSEIASATPPWIAGVAYGDQSTVLLFPARSARYPHDSLADVLHHEIAHVLIHRAAHGNDVPRWFNEGLASASERVWNADDRRQLAWALATRSRVRMTEVSDAFGGGPGRAEAAYALSSAFIRQVIDEYGIEAPAAILAGLADGLPFDRAFERATGVRFADAERNFSQDVTSWERWIPLITSPFVLWTLTTLLALYALIMFRVRRAEKRRLWEDEEQRIYEEESPQQPPDESHD
jgi:Peptidase MA superfamily